MARNNLASWAGDLARPGPVLAAGVLVANDHVLKGAGLMPGAITGKLSDVTGLFVAGILAVCAMRGAALAVTGGLPPRHGRAAILALIAVAVAFSALKLWPGLNYAAARLWGHNVLDPSDLYALPVLLLALLWLRDRQANEREKPGGRRFSTGIALVGIVLACAATPAPPPVPPRPVAGWTASDATRAMSCGTATAWVSKSGKTGFGVTLRMVQRSDAPCPVTITAARVRFGSEPAIAGQEIGIEQPSPRADSDRSRWPGHDRGEPPWDRTRYRYMAFAFDNNTRWNRGQRSAAVELDLVVDGKPVQWTVSVRQEYVSFPPGYR